MDRSVDSIGTCSLDVEASVEISDFATPSSVGTLRSASVATPEPQPRLPSYLSLACTVSGYSTTINYDPERLTKSRDASPRRPFQSIVESDVKRNTDCLSPPNLVPLPLSIARRRMEERTVTVTSNQFYVSTGTKISQDHVDCDSRRETSELRFSAFRQVNGIETKSFIQQRVERLYGPGALAQGFFITKKRLNRSYDEDTSRQSTTSIRQHSKSMIDSDAHDRANTIKQSCSTPTLPVLRHLRPEFRAQLPIVASKKEGVESSDGQQSQMQKSITVPVLKEQNINGHVENGKDDPTVKDGRYFMNVLERETKRLLELAAEVEKDLECDSLSEEVRGKLRSASGKARLLASQKIQQFKGLCANNINQQKDDAFPTTNEDLQGFWDMVLLQVAQIDKLFQEIDTLKRNDWKEEVRSSPPATANVQTAKTRKVANRPRQVNEEARKQRELQRKKLIEEKRRAMRERCNRENASSEDIQIYAPHSS